MDGPVLSVSTSHPWMQACICPVGERGETTTFTSACFSLLFASASGRCLSPLSLFSVIMTFFRSLQLEIYLA